MRKRVEEGVQSHTEVEFAPRLSGLRACLHPGLLNKAASGALWVSDSNFTLILLSPYTPQKEMFGSRVSEGGGEEGPEENVWPSPQLELCPGLGKKEGHCTEASRLRVER